VVRRGESALGAVRCSAAMLCALAAQGCFDVKSIAPGPEAIAVETDSVGRVLDGNALGLKGYWYSYGDQYGTPARCTEWGGHAAADCSAVFSPPPLPALGFTNVDGKMCTQGEAAKLDKCKEDAMLPCPTKDGLDFANMWGAGIGLDFDLDVDDPEQPERATDSDHRHVWDPDAHRVVGVAFDLEAFDLERPDVGDVPYPNLRVEFPMLLPDGTRLPPNVATVLGDTLRAADGPRDLPSGSTSDEYPGGSPFWGAPRGSPPKWGGANNDASPAVQGHNEFLWQDVSAPPDAWSEYVFDRRKILSIQFHVPALTKDPVRLPYSFCISHLAFLRE